MKTVRAWFDTIKDKVVREKMFANQKKSEENKDHYSAPLSKKYDSMAATLSDAFTWAGTPEGEGFWLEIHDHFSNGTGTKTYDHFKKFDKSYKPRSAKKVKEKVPA